MIGTLTTRTRFVNCLAALRSVCVLDLLSAWILEDAAAAAALSMLCSSIPSSVEDPVAAGILFFEVGAAAGGCQDFVSGSLLRLSHLTTASSGYCLAHPHLMTALWLCPARH